MRGLEERGPAALTGASEARRLAKMVCCTRAATLVVVGPVAAVSAFSGMGVGGALMPTRLRWGLAHGGDTSRDIFSRHLRWR